MDLRFLWTQTQIHPYQFRAAVEEVLRANVEGDIVELGVWRGGAMIMAAAILQERRSDKHLHLFDAFDAETKGRLHETTKLCTFHTYPG